jgi:hypothetical protein
MLLAVACTGAATARDALAGSPGDTTGRKEYTTSPPPPASAADTVAVVKSEAAGQIRGIACDERQAGAKDAAAAVVELAVKTRL